jgi:hypothetical protein
MTSTNLTPVSIHPEIMTDPQMNALIEEYNAVVNRISAPLFDLYMDKWTVDTYKGSKNPSMTYICFTNPYSAVCMPHAIHVWMDASKINLAAISKLVDDIDAGTFIDKGVVHCETNKDAEIECEVILETSTLHDGLYWLYCTSYNNKHTWGKNPYKEMKFYIKKDKICELLAYIYTIASTLAVSCP